jgi:hypothetical protein
MDLETYLRRTEARLAIKRCPNGGGRGARTRRIGVLASLRYRTSYAATSVTILDYEGRPLLKSAGVPLDHHWAVKPDEPRWCGRKLPCTVKMGLVEDANLIGAMS